MNHATTRPLPARWPLARLTAALRARWTRRTPTGAWRADERPPRLRWP
jgi:hypothetical protein